MPDGYHYNVYKCRKYYPGDRILSNIREYTFLINVSDFMVYTHSVYTFSARNITIFIKNMGNAPIQVHLQNSPNDLDYADDNHILKVAGGKVKTLVPYIFSKHMRLACIGGSGSCSAKIWFEIQEFDYQQCIRTSGPFEVS